MNRYLAGNLNTDADYIEDIAARRKKLPEREIYRPPARRSNTFSNFNSHMNTAIIDQMRVSSHSTTSSSNRLKLLQRTSSDSCNEFQNVVVDEEIKGKNSVELDWGLEEKEFSNSKGVDNLLVAGSQGKLSPKGEISSDTDCLSTSKKRKHETLNKSTDAECHTRKSGRSFINRNIAAISNQDNVIEVNQKGLHHIISTQENIQNQEGQRVLLLEYNRKHASAGTLIREKQNLPPNIKHVQDFHAASVNSRDFDKITLPQTNRPLPIESSFISNTNDSNNSLYFKDTENSYTRNVSDSGATNIKDQNYSKTPVSSKTWRNSSAVIESPFERMQTTSSFASIVNSRTDMGSKPLTVRMRMPLLAQNRSLHVNQALQNSSSLPFSAPPLSPISPNHNLAITRSIHDSNYNSPAETSSDWLSPISQRKDHQSYRHPRQISNQFSVNDRRHDELTNPTYEFYNASNRTCTTASTRRHSDNQLTSPDILQDFHWTTPLQSRWRDYEEPFVDSHCHIDFLYRRQSYTGSFESYRKLNSSSFPPNYQGCVQVFCSPASFKPYGLWCELAKEDDIWLTFGCHPKFATEYDDDVEMNLRQCLSHPKVVAAGEFGLDYSAHFQQYEETQKSVFRRQLKIALSMNLPLVIHCRQAEDDTFDIMKEIVPRHTHIHRHCFTGDFSEARRWLDHFPNLFIGLTNLVTFPRVYDLHNVAIQTPLHRLLLETDAPYFKPHEIRSRIEFSHPGMAIFVAERIASLRQISVEAVLRACRENTQRMYGI